MATVTASAGVKLSQSTGRLSGSTTITGTDDRGNKTTLATISASGSPQKGSTPLAAGSSNGWNLNVVYNNNGTSNGAANGSWSGLNWNPSVTVDVDAPGRSRHRGKSKKARTKGRKTAKRSPKKKATKKVSKRRSPVRRKKAPSRKKGTARRKKAARR